MVANDTFGSFLRDIARFTPHASTACGLQKMAHLLPVCRGAMVPLDHTENSLAYVASGATKLIASASAGREQIVAFHFRGDLVSVPANAWHSYDLCALVDTQILVFPAREFIDLTRADPAFEDILLERSLTALHRCRDKAVGLGRKNAQERLASFLVGMAERIGSREDGSTILDLPMSRRDIGDSLGLTIETISRQFGELRKSGLVQTVGRCRVELCDLAELAKRAGHA